MDPVACVKFGTIPGDMICFIAYQVVDQSTNILKYRLGYPLMKHYAGTNCSDKSKWFYLNLFKFSSSYILFLIVLP